MAIHDHSPSGGGRTFLLGGIVLGGLFVAFMFSHGFGFLRGHSDGAGNKRQLLRQGDRIIIPEGSPLRSRLGLEIAPSRDISATLVLPGIVESDPSRTALVLPPLGGRLLELRVRLGDRVHQGQVLAVIDSPDLAQAYDDDDKAADTERLTAKLLARQEDQFKIGTASDRDVDQARSDHAQAAAEYARTKARLRAVGAQEGTGATVRALLVRAPVSGSVISLSVSPGNMINDPTQPMMTIADLNTVWVTAMVPEKDVSAVATGQVAEVTLQSYPGRALSGKVWSVSDIIEPDTRRNKVRIAFVNSDYRLKPNMFATVRLAGEKRSQVELPTSALLMNNDRTSVFVAVAPWEFVRRAVDVQLEEGQTVTIRSGVSAGDQVVVRGGVLLND